MFSYSPSDERRGSVVPGGDERRYWSISLTPDHPEWRRRPPHHPNPLPGLGLGGGMVVKGSVAGGPRVPRRTIPIESALVVWQAGGPHALRPSGDGGCFCLWKNYSSGGTHLISKSATKIFLIDQRFVYVIVCFVRV